MEIKVGQLYRRRSLFNGEIYFVKIIQITSNRIEYKYLNKRHFGGGKYVQTIERFNSYFEINKVYNSPLYKILNKGIDS